MRLWAKVGILGAAIGLLWGQEEPGPSRLVVYEELIDRFFAIRYWSSPAQIARPETTLYLKASGKVPGLQRFSSLQALYLSDLEELDLPTLVAEVKRSCPKLKVLALEDCDIEDISPLLELSLEGLLLDDNPIRDFSPLSRMGKLQFLSLARTPLQELGQISRISSLQALDLSETRVSDLSPLSQLPKLRMISLFRCTAVRDLKILLGFAGNLELLNISHVQPEAVRPLVLELGRFTRLRVLQAQGIIQEGAAIAALSSLGQIEELTLGQNPAIQDLSFVRLLRRLLYLDVHRCNVRDLSPLAGLPYLVKLSIGKNQITSIAPLTQCPRLAYLYCYENPIQDWEKLAEIPSLQYVMLGARDLPPERLRALREQLRRKGVQVDVPGVR